MKIPDEVKRKKGKEVTLCVRVTLEDKQLMDKNGISPTALFNWALEKVKVGV